MENRGDDPQAIEDEEEARCQKERGREIQDLFAIPDEGIMVQGGIETGLAFNEMRSAYYYGLWLSTIFAGVAALERHIGAVLFGQGLPAASTMTFCELTKTAEQLEHISHFEKVKFDEIHLMRNDYMQFREPMFMIQRFAEAGEVGLGVNDLVQSDARMVLALVSEYYRRNCAP